MAQPTHDRIARTAHDAWRRLCRAARPHISPSLFRVCFAGTHGMDLCEGVLTIAVPSASVCRQMNRRFADLLAGLAPRALQQDITLQFVVQGATEDHGD